MNAKGTEVKELGFHKDCGGQVRYLSTGSFGISYCLKCNMNSHKPSTNPEGLRIRPTAPILEPEPKPPEIASESYAARRAAIDFKLQAIASMLIIHKGQFDEDGSTNWSYVGDLGKVDDDLGEVLSFLAFDGYGNGGS